ncbi:hypothetical protein MKX03_032509 [Papaver bracteatum]|nr:hypothetical protein MKX03_032509 [Papaver bracteatum]
MQSPCLKEASQVCIHGCGLIPLLSLPESSNSKDGRMFTNTVAASRVEFATSTTLSLDPNFQFTNPESLPSLAESFYQFSEAYPLYSKTEFADRIRREDYNHLSVANHVCLDYIGLGLFSHSQQEPPQSSSLASTSSSPPPPPPQHSEFPFFEISYKAANLSSQILYGAKESELESAIKEELWISSMCLKPNTIWFSRRTEHRLFKLLAESYPFQSNKSLLTVYDYESEAVDGMIEKSKKRGAKVMQAEFMWPRMRIHSTKLRKMLVSRRKKKKGLFVFPLQSRMTGARYSYQWMNLAQENGWHVVLDACALGPKDMGTLGLSLFKPDFIISSFFKVFGDNPSGFGCLFVKKSSAGILETSATDRSIGIVSLTHANDATYHLVVILQDRSSNSDKNKRSEEIARPGETFTDTKMKQKVQQPSCEIVELEPQATEPAALRNQDNANSITCKGLDNADSLGLILITNRLRCLINWLIKFDRGPALAFNVFDWKGEKVEPSLVQKLADRSNISLSYGYLQNIWFSDKYEEEKKKGNLGITVVTATFGFLTNFEDAYRLWTFVAQFLDADFVEKERWRYTALDQKIIEV